MNLSQIEQDIIRWAKEAKLPYYYRTGEITNLPQLQHFARLVAEFEREAEREACAKVCDVEAEFVKSDKDGSYSTARNCAEAIRARWQA